MIGMAGEDRRRPIELLEQHDAGKRVGPGQLAETEGQSRLIAQLVSEAVGAADDKACCCSARIAPCAQPFCKGGAANGLAALVQRDKPFGRGERSFEQRAFCDASLLDAGFRIRAARFDFMQNCGADAHRPCKLIQPLLITLDQLALTSCDT